MSDALTDIARDERRAASYSAYLQSIVDWLEQPSDFRRTRVQNAALECDAVPRGYWSGTTSLEPNVGDFLDRLYQRERSAWAGLILDTRENGHSTEMKRLGSLCLFPTKWVRQVSFQRFERMSHDMWSWVFQANGLATNQGNGYDRYALIMDPSKTLGHIVQNAIWLGFKLTSWYGDGRSGYPTPKTPYLKDREAFKHLE